MTVLPIVERELRVAARRRGTYWARTGGAFVACILCAWGLLFVSEIMPSRLGQTLFIGVSSLAFCYCLLAGLRTTADCLSEEKREGTLGLLFLTDLKGYDVVFGKLAATSVNAAYGLLAVFPIMAISLPLGGVSAGEFWRMMLALSNTLFFSLSAGVFVSAISRRSRSALAGTFLLILLVTATTPALGLSLAAMHHNWPPDGKLLIPSAGCSFVVAFDDFYSRLPTWYWFSLAITHAWSWVFLGSASVVVTRAWQDRPAGVVRLRWRDRWKQWSYGDAGARTAYRTRLLNANPIFWLSGRDRLKPAYVWAFLGLALCVWVWGALKFSDDWFDEGVYLMTAFLLNTALKFWVGSEAGRRFVEDRRSNALELLLSTPLTVAEFLRGQILAMRRQFFGPVIAVLSVNFLFLAIPMAAGDYALDRDVWLLTYTTAMIMLVADIYTLCWVGMWVGLTARQPNRVTGTTLARVLLLPWVAHLLLFISLVFISHMGWIKFNFDPGETFNLAAWFFFGLLNDALFFWWSRQSLYFRLREVAASRFSPAAGGRWRRWWPFGQSDGAATPSPLRARGEVGEQ